jgi:hypothetical protein
MSHNNSGFNWTIAICVIGTIFGLIMFAATSDRNGRGGHGFVVVPR